MQAVAVKNFLSLDEEARLQMHKAFNQWLLGCNEADFSLFMRAKESVAHGQPCSVARLIQSCWINREARDLLPGNLAKLLQEKHLLPV